MFFPPKIGGLFREDLAAAGTGAFWSEPFNSERQVRPTNRNKMNARSLKALPSDLRTNPPMLLNERELSVVIGLCPRSIRNHVRAGIIPQIKIGRRTLFRWQQVEAALAKLEGRVL